MHLEEFRQYCLGLPFVTEDFPFDKHYLAFRICNKIFALTNVEDAEPSVNLKAEPEQAIIWREQYVSVQPGFHMNKKHWNTVSIMELPDHVVKEMILHSYENVWQKLPLKIRKEKSPDGTFELLMK